MFTFRELFCEGITVHGTGFLLPISSAESQDIEDICGSIRGKWRAKMLVFCCQCAELCPQQVFE
jgi:hypothetical protein